MITPQPRALRDERDYDHALARIDALMNATDAEAVSELETWVILVEAYESRAHPLPAPSPLGNLEHVMEARGLTRADLAAVLGSRARAAEVLAGRRALSKDMIRRLVKAWGLSADILIGPLEMDAA